VTNISDIRNIVLLGHAGSGKTSLVESILHKTGATNRLGSVDEKTSICDYYDEEKEHQHSIQSAVVHQPRRKALQHHRYPRLAGLCRTGNNGHCRGGNRAGCYQRRGRN